MERFHAVKCPFCGCDNVHIEKVTVNRGGEITDISINGTHLNSGESEGSGAAISIIYWCESFHKWEQKQVYGKGNTYIENIMISDCMKCCSNAPDLY